VPDPMDPSINATAVYAFADTPLNQTSILVLGPMQVNDSFALLSMTLPIVDNSNSQIVLGFMTVVASASSLIDITNSREGLANTGIVLMIGPSRRPNRFSGSQIPFGNNNIIPTPEARM
jgi:osomolarity two-component system sensor histidine kinase SLN1